MDSILGDGFDVCNMLAQKVGKVILVDSYSSTGWLNHQLSSDQNPGYLLYIGDYTPTLAWGFLSSPYKDPCKPSRIQWQVSEGVCFVGSTRVEAFNPPRSPSKGDIPK